MIQKPFNFFKKIMNKLFITDLHPEYRDFIHLYCSWGKEEFFQRLEEGLFIHNEQDKEISLYLGGDMFSYISYGVWQNLFLNWLAHLFLIRKFVDEKGLVVKSIKYIYGNHEFYLNTNDVNFETSSYLFAHGLNIENFNELQIEFLGFLEYCGFILRRNNIIYPKGLRVLNSPEKFESMRVVRDLYEGGLSLIFPEANIQKINNSINIIGDGVLLMGNTLFAPYLWKFNKNITTKELEPLNMLNDKNYLFQNYKNWALGRLSHLEIFENWFDSVGYYAPDLIPLIEDFEYIRKELVEKKEPSIREFYYITQFFFLYGFLTLMSSFNVIWRDKNIKNPTKHIEIMTHFPFNVFSKEFENEYQIKHHITEKNLEKVLHYQKDTLNSYFNIDESYLRLLLSRLNRENFPNLETVTFFCGHTHIPHTSSWESEWISFKVVNRSS